MSIFQDGNELILYLPDHVNAASLRIEYPDKNNRAQASESFDKAPYSTRT